MIHIKKSFATFGFIFLTILIINSFLSTSSNIKAGSSSNLLNVPFFEQEKHYYCGPASLQMVIAYLTGSVPSQELLAYELETDHIKNVTYTAKMRIPFNLRNLNQIYTVEGMLVSELKLQSAQGFLVILLIWFDVPLKEKNHYVVVVGYNETGVFIHDPWPTSWSKPGRNTGPYVFISDSELEYLWDCERFHWALVIQYKSLSSDKRVNL